MNYRVLKKDEYPKWDIFVDTSPQGSIYTKSFYLDCIGYSYTIAVVEKGQSIKGGIVTARNEVQMQTNPLFTKYLGVLYSPDTFQKTGATYKIDREILENVTPRGVWSYSFHPNYKNWLCFYWKGFKQTTCYTYQIDFRNKDDFRSRYGEKVKAPLRVSKKNELLIDDIDIETFVEVNRSTYVARNTKPPYSDERLTNLLNALSKHDCIYIKSVKDHDGNTHATAAIIYDHRMSNLILNGSDPKYRKFGGNTMLIDHMLEYSSKNHAILDFEGSMHERIEAFYRGFGGELTPYYKITKINFASMAYDVALKVYKKLRYSGG